MCYFDSRDRVIVFGFTVDWDSTLGVVAPR